MSEFHCRLNHTLFFPVFAFFELRLSEFVFNPKDSLLVVVVSFKLKLSFKKLSLRLFKDRNWKKNNNFKLFFHEKTNKLKMKTLFLSVKNLSLIPTLTIVQGNVSQCSKCLDVEYE